jgi:hypothetical protein
MGDFVHAFDGNKMADSEVYGIGGVD